MKPLPTATSSGDGQSLHTLQSASASVNLETAHLDALAHVARSHSKSLRISVFPRFTKHAELRGKQQPEVPPFKSRGRRAL